MERLDALAQRQSELREDFNAQMSEFRQEMARLRQDMAKGFERHEAELARLREDFSRMVEVVGGLQRQHRALERRLDSSIAGLTSAMAKGFAELGKFAGISFEEFVRVFLSEWLRSSGYMPRNAERARADLWGEVGRSPGLGDQIRTARRRRSPSDRFRFIPPALSGA